MANVIIIEIKLQNENSDLYKEIEDLQIYQTKLLKKLSKYIDRFESAAMELSDTKCGPLNNLSVIVNNERYKII